MTSTSLCLQQSEQLHRCNSASQYHYTTVYVVQNTANDFPILFLRARITSAPCCTNLPSRFSECELFAFPLPASAVLPSWKQGKLGPQEPAKLPAASARALLTRVACPCRVTRLLLPLLPAAAAETPQHDRAGAQGHFHAHVSMAAGFYFRFNNPKRGRSAAKTYERPVEGLTPHSGRDGDRRGAQPSARPAPAEEPEPRQPSPLLPRFTGPPRSFPAGPTLGEAGGRPEGNRLGEGKVARGGKRGVDLP